MPKLPDLFQTRVELTINRESNTIREIYFDYTKKQAAYKDQSASFERLYVFDYKQDEINLIASNYS